MTTNKLSTEDLAAELARRQQDQEAEAAHQAAELKAAQHDYYRNALAMHRELDEQLGAEGMDHLTSSRAALQELDLNAAFAGFTKWKATRITRDEIRSAAQSAAAVLATGEAALTPLRDVNQTFTEWLHIETSGAHRPEVPLAEGETEKLLGIYPQHVASTKA